MRIKITQTNLHRALGLLTRVATSKAPLPILSNILFTAKEHSLELSATNLEVAITNQTVSKIDQTGAVTVPARLLHEFVGGLPKDTTIELVFDKTKLFISAGGYSSHIQGASAEDFPALPTVQKGATVQITGTELKNALERTMLAVSRDETRPVLGGVYFHVAEEQLYLAATDGYRLAEAKLTSSKDEFNGIVPIQTIQDIQRILQDNQEETVTLQFDESQLSLVSGQTTLVSRLIEGQYPAYQQLIPEKSDISFTIARDELLTAAKLAGLFARESGGSITLRANEDDNQIIVSSVASQVGDNSSTLPAKVRGSGEVVVNVRYLTEALNCFDSKDINFRFSGAISPCVLSSVDQPGYQHIVMPLKS